MVKNIKNSGSGSSKNIRNDDSLKLSTLKVIDATITNATITNLTNTELQTATSDISTLQTAVSTNTTNIANKQDIITDSTDIELNQLDVNSRIRLFFNDSTDNDTMIERGDAQGKLKFTANNVFFHDDNDTEVFAIKNNGDLNCFDNSIDNVADIDFNGSSLISQLSAKQDIITAGDGLSFTGSTLNAEVTQAELDAKQNTITAGDGLSFTGSTLNAEVTQAELDDKQDILEAGDQITMGNLTIDQPGSTNVVLNMKNSTTNDLFRIVYNTDSNFAVIQLSDDGVGANSIIRITTNEIRFNAEFDMNSNDIINGAAASFSSISLNGSDLQGKIDAKQDNIAFVIPIESVAGLIRLNYNSTEFTVNASDELELTGTLTSNLNLNSNNLTNGGSGSFSSISLNSNDLQGLIDDKANDFVVNSNGLILDSGAFPLPELRFLYDTTYFLINGSDELSWNGVLPTLTSDLNMGNNTITNVEEVENAVKFVEFGGSPNSASNNLWGNDNIHDVWVEGVNINSTGMISQASGVFTINEAGTYTISCDSSIENVDYNNRLVAAQYISVNDDTTRFRSTPGSFAFSYVRDENFGVSNSLSFSTTIVLAQNDTIRFKTKLGKATDNRAYDDTHSDTGLNWWCGVRFTKHLIV